MPNGGEGQYHRMSRDAGMVAKERRMRRKDPSPARPLAYDSYHFLRQQHRQQAHRFSHPQQLGGGGGGGSAVNDDDDDDDSIPSTII
jgi:hypothetical protein